MIDYTLSTHLVEESNFTCNFILVGCLFLCMESNFFQKVIF